MEGIKYTDIEVMSVKNLLINCERNQNFREISNIGTVNRAVVNVVIKDAGGGGDCFYFSMYEALESRGYLELLSNSLGMPGFTDKKDFNIKIRELISDNIDDSVKDMIQHFCETFLIQNMSNVDSLKLSLLTLPVWLQNIIKKHVNIKSCGNIEQVYNLVLREVKASIIIPGNWAGELEVAVIKNMLDTVGIELTVHNRKLSKLIDFEIFSRDIGNIGEIQPHRIVLYNSGELHYQYYLFPKAPVKRNRQGGYYRTKKQKKSKKNRRTKKFRRV